MTDWTGSIQFQYNETVLINNALLFLLWIFYCELPENLIPLKFSVSASLNNSKPK